VGAPYLASSVRGSHKRGTRTRKAAAAVVVAVVVADRHHPRSRHAAAEEAAEGGFVQVAGEAVERVAGTCSCTACHCKAKEQ